MYSGDWYDYFVLLTDCRTQMMPQFLSDLGSKFERNRAGNADILFHKMESLIVFKRYSRCKQKLL